MLITKALNWLLYPVDRWLLDPVDRCPICGDEPVAEHDTEYKCANGHWWGFDGQVTFGCDHESAINDIGDLYCPKCGLDLTD